METLTSLKKTLIPIVVMSATLLTGCGGGTDNDNAPSNNTGASLNLNLPDSMTGGRVNPASQSQVVGAVATGVQQVVAAVDSGTGQPCAYIGIEDDDPFRNGYQMSKFMVGVTATWTCIADVLIDIADFLPHDSVIRETKNDKSAANYDREDPTHYSITADSKTQSSIRLYYDYDRMTPPQQGEDPQFFISWNTTSKNNIEGRLIIDGMGVNPDDRKETDPVMMRMDFNYTGSEKVADMFLQFDNGNPWAEGFRIQVTKDLTANPLQDVFLARGLVEMKAQFLPVANISEVPTVHFYTVSDSFGNGAAIADFQDVSLPLELNANTNNHLGNYLFSKIDTYYFQYDQDWDYINKTISTSEYRDNRTTPATGGTWMPFDPSLDIIITGLALDNSYFTGNLCANVGDDCTELLNAIFIDGFAGQEKNQGSNPMDWRTTIMSNPDYLTSVYPNGAGWDGAFDYIFMPSF